MEQFVWFLGRFHVLAVHLPLGILTLAVVFEILARFKPFKALENALAPIWIAGALSAIGAVTLGFMHATEAPFQDMPAVEAHRWAGVSLCVLACVVALLRMRLHPVSSWPRWAGPEKLMQPVYGAVQRTFSPGSALDRRYDRLWAAPVAAILSLMFLTGHLGGNLTQGETYLIQYAPGPVRVLAGLPADAGPRARPKDLASADIYLDVVKPALDQRCSSCHNNSKTSGGLSVASYDALMKGGSKGPVITPGKPAASDLFHRVNLAEGSSDFMPKDGKTPLTKNEIAAIGWWIEQGAPKSAAVGSLKLTADASSAIQSIIGVEGAEGDQQASAAGPGEAALPTVPEADKAAVAKVVAEGFIVRKAFKGSNLVEVNYTSPKPVTPEIIQQLARFAPNILSLNLRRAGLTDAEVKTIASFSNLRALRLEKNDITDAGAKDIAALKDLTSLNLTNTKVTDQGLAAVAQLPKLQRLYMWGAAVSPAAVDKVRAARKDMTLDDGLTVADVPAETKVIPPDF